MKKALGLHLAVGLAIAAGGVRAGGTGAELYAKHCAACHGATGRGDGKAAYLLSPRPRDFGTGRFRLISTVNSVPSDDDLFRTITRGMPGSAMPPWVHLPETDRRALVSEVRRMSVQGQVDDLVAGGTPVAEAREVVAENFAVGDVVAVPPETPRDGSDLARGQAMYLKTCASCHGTDGRGKSQSPMVDDLGLPVTARDFTRGVFKGGSSTVDIAWRILAGQPGSPMPAYRGAFPTDQDFWAMTHFTESLIAPGAQARVEQKQTEVRAVRVAGALPATPEDPAWGKVRGEWLALMPLAWRDARVEGVEVKALHDGRAVAFRLSWEDPVVDEHVGDQTAFADAVAVQISTEADPPFFAMGSPGHPVSIIQWKAHWQRDLASGGRPEPAHPRLVADLYPALKKPPYGQHAAAAGFALADFEPTWMTGWGAGNPLSRPDRTGPCESLVASGFGTAATVPGATDTRAGNGSWKQGRWTAMLVRPLAGGPVGQEPLAPGRPASIGFAVWDGAARDRDGQKSVTIWHRLVLTSETEGRP